MAIYLKLNQTRSHIFNDYEYHQISKSTKNIIFDKASLPIHKP